MDAYKIAVKLFAESDTFGADEFVPVFHRWIQTHALDGHLLVDVADYAHVPAGPGTVLVSSEANIYADRGDNKLGILYVRKQPIAGAETFRDRLRAVLIETLKIAAKLEEEPGLAGRLKFRTDDISIRVNDRLLAPNTVETFAAVKADIESVARELTGAKPATVEQYRPGSQSLFEVRVKMPDASSASKLLETLGVPSPVSV